MKILIKHILEIILTFIILFGLEGCINELENDTDQFIFETECISFSPRVKSQTKSSEISNAAFGVLAYEVQDWVLDNKEASLATKSSPINQLLGDAGVTVFQYSDSWSGTEKSWKLTNEKFSFDGNALTVTEKSKEVKWYEVTGTNLKVFAYAPYVATSDITEITGIPSLPYTIDSDVTKQVDIVAASADVAVSSAKGKSIPLEFEHVLTAVKFRAGFECTVNSISINDVYGIGTYSVGGDWTIGTPENAKKTYTIAFDGGKSVKSRDMIIDNELTLMLLPQTVPAGATLTMSYTVGSETKTFTSPLSGLTWEKGKMITYTLYDQPEGSNYIYFDLAAGNVLIGCTEDDKNQATSSPQYTGYVFENGSPKQITGTHNDQNIYYVYQTTPDNKGNSSNPNTSSVTYNGRPWAEYIENNPSVANVIKAWNTVGRVGTDHRIRVYGSNKTVNLTIDDIYSTYAERSVSRTTAGIGFNAGENANLIITVVGDNRLGAIHYHGGKDKNNTLVFEGTGTLTVAAASGKTEFYNKTYVGEKSENDTTFIDNHWCSAIGGNDSSEGNSHGIIINSGNIYAGTTKAENCTAIGAGGNDHATITINGGTVTAVGTTTGTAIGGGIGFNSSGGTATVTIKSGNVYAYNHSNRWDIPSAAIGGAGSDKGYGNTGTVIIEGGNVYAQSAIGTALGGGSSNTQYGGTADIRISGGNIIAKSIKAESGKTSGKWIDAGSGIGGGTGCTGGIQSDAAINVNGGKATIRISGNPVIKTGSIGGGKSGHATRGNIGTADIEVSGGDIQAQFVMAGSVLENSAEFESPKFTMTGGLIRNSDVHDSDFYHIVTNGGAVYMEDGSFEMTGGTIRDCSAEYGGAIYIKKGANSPNPPTFTMTGGEILKCTAKLDGGAVYLENGTVEISGEKTRISFNKSGESGGAICVKKTGSTNPSFTMSGGTISDNTAETYGGALHLEGGLVTLSGGFITNNIVSNGNGGGISINSGSFIMPENGDATINANSVFTQDGTTGNGGGVYVTSTSEEVVKVDIHSGKIIGNSSATRGGGIGVDVSTDGTSAIVTVGQQNSENTAVPDISGNITLLEGGGLYVNGAQASIIINSGKIRDNSTVGVVDNPDVMNNEGMVTLNGGNVKSVNVTYYGNEGSLESTGTNTGITSKLQRIVTDTNNKLVIPDAFRNGYRLTRWNTRPDGLGTDYTNGQVVKRSTDLNLYAIWEVQ